jgi:hypothetical protein
MNLIWALVLIVSTLFCWLGQAITAFFPSAAVKLGLSERESDVDEAFWADVRGEAVWDTMILWTLPVAGLLLLLNHPLWVYFGLVGSGMYLYFAGRGILTRLAMQRRGIRIGYPRALKVVYMFLALWGLISIGTILMAVRAF